MWSGLIALALLLALPAGASAGPLKDAVEKAGRDLGTAQAQEERGRSRARLWSGIALIAGGGVLAALGGFEFRDDETGPDDGEDFGPEDDGEDSDGWGNKTMIGGGIAAATIGGVLLLTGRSSGPSVSSRRGGVVVRQTLRF